MSEAIQVLVDLASNATLDNQENITTMLADANISLEQEQAIVAKDSESLAKKIYDLPKIEAIFPLIPAEDEEPQEDNQESEPSESKNLLISNI